MSTDLARQTDTQHDLAVADREQAAGALAHILATGDLAKLSNEQRVGHYLDLCQSLSLNPRSRPFDWLLLDGKLVLYPNKSCTEQLARLHGIRIQVTAPVASPDGSMLRCVATGHTPDGRTDSASKYVPLTAYSRDRGEYRLKGKELANAYMKAETGAKRRLVLSMIGLAAPPDPDDVKNVRYVVVDGTGRIIDNPTPEQKALAADPSMARMLHETTYEDADASTALMSGQPDQRVTDDELTPPERPTGERPSFRPSEEDIKAFERAWFAAVKGLSLDSDDARHAFVRDWTADEWPKAKRTDSLPTMRMRMTQAEADDFLAHVRALMEDEKRELLAHTQQVEDAQPRRTRGSDKVADSVALTGGPAPVESAEPAF